MWVIGMLFVAFASAKVGGEFFSETEYIKATSTPATVTEEVDTVQAQIDNAIAASSTEIEKAAQEAAQATRDRMEAEIELRVRKASQNASASEIEALEKELGVY